MVSSLLDEFGQRITALTLLPSSGGAYEVTIDGELVYSKKATGEHADYEDVAGPVRQRTAD